MRGKGHGEKLSRWQEVAIGALLSEPSVRRAARKARLDVDTLRAWLKDETFTLAYAEARRELLQHAVSRLAAEMGRAVACLVRNMRSGKAPSEVAAAVAILDRGIKGGELLDVMQRLEALESGQRGAT